MAGRNLEIKIKINSETGEVVALRNSFGDLNKTIQNTSNYTDSFVKKMKDFAIAAGISYGIYKLVDSLKELTASLIETSAKFERFEIILQTLDGSVKKAQKDMEWIKKFAKTTPYEIDQVTDAFVRLKSYGFDAKKDLKALGDTAAAFGRPIQDAVEAIADATTGEFERLKAFGMKTFVQGNKIALQWADAFGHTRHIIIQNNKDVIEHTILAIWNNRYAGAMDKLSMSWDGIISNMSDAWTNFKADTSQLSFKQAEKSLNDFKNSFSLFLTAVKKPMSELEVSIINTFVKPFTAKDMVDGFAGLIKTFGFIKDAVTGVELVIETLKLSFYGLAAIAAAAFEPLRIEMNKLIELNNKIADSWIGHKMGLTKIYGHFESSLPDIVNKIENVKNSINNLAHSLHKGRDEADKFVKSLYSSYNNANRKAIVEKLDFHKYVSNLLKNSTKEVGVSGAFNRNMFKETKELKAQKNVYENIIALKTQDLQKTKELITKFKNEYINNFGTKEQQLEAWYKKEYMYIIQNLKLDKDRVKALKELNNLMVKKIEKLQKEKELEKLQKEQQSLGFDDKTYKAYKDLAKKFGRESAKQFATGLSVFMKSKNFNDLFNNLGNAIGGAGGFLVQHTQDVLKTLFDDEYDKIRNRYKDTIDAYSQTARDESFRANAYNAFGYEGYGQVASLKSELANIKATQQEYLMNYDLMSQAKEYKQTTQNVLEAGSVAAGIAAAAWFDGGAVLQGLNMAMDAQNWAEQATGFQKFQSDFINSVNTLKQSIEQFAKDLINLAGSVYKNISDYRSLYDKVTGTNTYKLQQEKEALSLVGQYTELTQSGVADLIQNVLQSSAEFVDEAVNTTQNVDELLNSNILDEYNLSIDALNSKFKDSINIVADLIAKQNEANKAIEDYIATLKKEIGQTDTLSTINAQADFAKAIQDYKTGAIDYNDLLEKAKAYQNAGGISVDEKIISALEQVTNMSTSEYLQNIANAGNGNAIALPEEQVENLSNPEIETLDAIKDTNSFLEQILDLLKNPSNILSGVEDILNNILKAINNIAGTILNVSGNMIAATTKAAASLLEGLSGVLKEVFSGLGNLLDGAWNWTSSAIKDIWSGMSDLVNVVKNLGGNVTGFFSNIITGATDTTLKVLNDLGIDTSSVDNAINTVSKFAGDAVSTVADVAGSAAHTVTHAASSAWHSITHFHWAEGGYTGQGSYRDSTGERVAGIVHEGEWVAPKWMVNSFPSLFASLEKARISKSDISIPALAVANNNVNVSVNIAEMQHTNSILQSQLSIQKKMYRLMQKFDEEGIRCIS